MEGFLIDFDSPKQKRDETLLPECSTGFLLPFGGNSTNNHSCMEANQDNPFDLVTSQVAANTADQNDPFEMVLNDALSCHDQKESTSVKHASSEASHLNVGDPTFATSHDLPKIPEKETSDHVVCDDTAKNISKKVAINSPSSFHRKCESNLSIGDLWSQDWSCLDDIPPPDSLLSSFEDTSYLLDDSLSTSILSFPSGKENALSDELDLSDICNSPSDPKSLFGTIQSVPSSKSEEDLKLLAQKKIQNLISRAEFEVKLNIEESVLMKRLSIQNTPSTPRSLRDALWESKEQSRCLHKWSQEEFKTFNLVSNMTQSVSGSCSASLESDIESKICKDTVTIGSLCGSSQGTPSKVSSPSLPEQHLMSTRSRSLQLISAADNELVGNDGFIQSGHSASQMQPSQITPLQGNLCSEDAKSIGQIGKKSSLTSSPVLLPLPLCEDAVRNLSLCSKYSPGKDVPNSKSVNGADDSENKTAVEKLAESSKHAKLVVRKPTEYLKAQPKLAPMKATAPIQNMTRAKSSLTAHFKSEPCNSTGLIKKSVPKVSSSRMPVSGGLRKSGSLTPTLGGSLPNLTSQVSKLPTRLPSPRRSSGSSQQRPLTPRKRGENLNDKNLPSTLGSSPFVYSSPRPLNKSKGRSSSLSRVLTDVNASPIARKSMKCRNIQVEVTKRGPMSSEKENVL